MYVFLKAVYLGCCLWRCIKWFVLGASFRRDAKYEPTGRAKRRFHGEPSKELLDAVLDTFSNYGV